MNEPRNIIIIGSGPAGLTAGTYASRANLEPLLFEGAIWGGQLMITTEVENYPGFPDGIDGPPLMANFRKQAERFGTEIRSEDVTRVDFTKYPFEVFVDDDRYTAKSIIISTGAVARSLGVPGETELTGHGLSYCATCDGFFFRDKHIFVVGGGDTAMEEALFLTKFGSQVTIVHRRHEFRASKIMAERALSHPKIDVMWNTVPREFVGENGKLVGFKATNTVTGDETQVEAGGVFIGIGHDPATKLFQGKIDLDRSGYINVNHPHTSTTVDGVFAGGDCVDHIFRQAVTAAGMGCAAAIDAERWLAERDS